MNIKIRKIVEDDFSDLILLFQEFATFEKLPHKMVNSVEQMKEESSLINGFVAVNNQKKIIGYVTYFFAYYTWVGKSLYMDDLYIKPEYRGKGFGTLLINKVVEFAKTHKCKKLRWQVSEWNQPAIEFYNSLGASVDATESNCDLKL